MSSACAAAGCRWGGGGLRLYRDGEFTLSPKTVIAIALAAKADLVVSGDRHMLSMGSFEGLTIVTAAEAVRRIGRN